MLPKLILATLCCLVLVPPQSQALSVEERMTQHDGELEHLRDFVRALQGQIEEMKQPRNEGKSPCEVRQNDTEELEARVTVLEESMVEVEQDVVVLQTSLVTLADEVDDVETDNTLQDERLNTLEAEIFDNENDIEELVDTTTLLQIQVTDIEEDILILDLRVTNLESGGGSVNVTDLTERVENLEDVTSQMSGDISELQTTTEDFETRIAELESVIIEPWEACLSSPCDNGATCVDVNVDTFICMCRDEYFGLTCDESFTDAAFLASLLSSVSGRFPDPIIFEWEVINPGGHYSNVTGKYTVPYDGIYQFSAHLQYSSGIGLEMFVDDAQDGIHNDYWSSSDHYRTTTLLQELSAGQTVYVTSGSGSTNTGGTTSLYSYFSGHLISSL